MKKYLNIALGLLAGLALVSAASAEQFVYPAKGQSPEKQQKDESECQAWAVKQSGYDPAKPVTAAPPPQPTGPSGARLRGAAAGAALGAITDNDAGDAAVAGAVGAGVAERSGRRRSARQQQQVAQDANKAGDAALLKARAACLEGRGYTVK